MRQNTIRKRTISCIIALALVFSCVLTAFAGSVIPFSGDDSDNKTTIEVDMNGGKVFYSKDGAAEQRIPYSFHSSPALGTHFKFRAEDTASRTFLYWQDEYTGRVVSYDRTVEFTCASRVHLRAIFANVSDTQHWVSYVNYGGSLMTDGQGHIGESYTIGQKITAPSATDAWVPGFTFKFWSKGATEIANSTEDLVVYPIYTVQQASYTVTLTDDTYASGAGTYSNFQTVNLKAEEKNGSGESFSYWKDAESGAIVSYERNYSFRINYNVTLTAVFGETVTPEPVIRISTINRDTEHAKITFYAERSVPDTYTVISHGILMTSEDGITDAQLTLGFAGERDSSVCKAYGASNELCGMFSLAKSKVDDDREVAARPFIICADAGGSQYVVYGDVVRATNGDAV